MRDYQSFEVRNVSVIGHSGAGKTSVLEAMLYYTKATDRFGKTTEGSSMIDFDAEEIRRGLSVYTTIVPIEWEDSKINFIDTPGYLDFVGEKQGGFAVGDSSLMKNTQVLMQVIKHCVKNLVRVLFHLKFLSLKMEKSSDL